MRPILYFGLIIFVYLFSYWYYRSWEKQIRFGGDGWGYYAYLPATFIYHDLDNLKETFKTSVEYGHPVGQGISNPLGTAVAHHVGEGKQVIKYTYGVSVLMAPFFLLAHWLAGLLDFPQDGFSPPYMVGGTIFAMFYVLLGLWILNLFLKEYFSKKIAALITVVLALSTNLYFFSVYLTPMSHGPLFFWYCGLLYATHCFYKNKKLKHALIIGLCCGFITVIRPNEIICLFIPLLYGIGSWPDFKNRFNYIFDNFSKYAAMATVFIIPVLPQILYWLWLTGKPLFYSYGNESFDFAHPHIIDGLLNFKNGWLIYTPVMWMAVAGLVLLAKDKKWRLPVFLFLPIHIYIIYSWWCWNYINGFGSRPMVETYALLSIPLGHFLIYAWKNKALKYLTVFLLVFFTALNLFQTWQFGEGILWSQDINKAYYATTFGKTEQTYEALIAFDSREIQPDTNDLVFTKQLYFNDFEDSLNRQYNSKIVKNGNYSFYMSGETRLSPVYEISVKDAGVQTGDWIKFSAWCRGESKGANWYQMNLMIIQFARDGNRWRERAMRIDNKIGGKPYSLWGGKTQQWEKLYFFAKVPYNVKPEDTLKVFVIRTPEQPSVFLDDMEVSVYK